MAESKVIDFEKYASTKGKTKMCMEIVEEIQEQRRNGHEYKIEEMKRLATKFLNSINYDGDGSVPIIKIAQQCGFKVICGSMRNKDMSGFVSVNERNRKEFDGNKIIGVNEDDELGHQRFVIAHEFAHYLFDYDCKSNKSYFDTYIKNSHKSSKEQIANAFAVNLLMPAKYFVLQFDEDESMDNNIKLWTKYFEVQEKSVEKRVLEVIKNGI